ncbi:MAG: hypothetical protein IM600_17450 [Bacteroidetes bacterium]|jgi:hypothetical protein|nr:hypothetical protein [Bacteroidota bacterium]MCA6445218.1 hypothetical protein [Bacteroidota bacterium]
MEDKQLNPNESIQLIEQMIRSTKNKLADDGVLLIFWGWLVVVSALVNYVGLQFQYENSGLVWAILMPVGGIFSALYGRYQNKQRNVKTALDGYLSYLWAGFGIALVITLVCGFSYGIKPVYFSLMILYGLATFVSGGLLGFKPLIYGGIASFICAVVSIFLSEMDQLLIIIIALLASYIIPGHLLRSKFKSQQNV